MPWLYDSQPQQPPKNGLMLLQGLILFLFFVFSFRLWYLQVHKGPEFAEMARENQLRRELVYAPRGLLRDRDGRLLAVNRPAYALAVVREDIRDVEATLAQVSLWTGMDLEGVQERYAQGRRRVKSFQPQILVPDISFELLARIEANTVFWPGLEIVVQPRRYYPQGPLMAHILGYVAEADEQELRRDPELHLGDMVGKQGLEFVLEDRLRGDKGLKQLEVDATGRNLNTRLLRRPEAGESIALSIDLGLQEYAAGLLRGKAGGIVVLEPDTGQVLALVTQPSYDNNAFAGGLSNQQWVALRDHPRHPLQNRVIQSTYPPGSVWKLIMAACGLHEGILDPGG
jgi:penicillin-binding protein 2